LGHFNPHTKQAVVDKEKADFYLKHGAQPSDRVARLLKAEGVKLPKWVQLEAKKTGGIRNPEKLRKNRPAEEPAPEEPKAEEPAAEEASAPEEATAVTSEEKPEEK
jgi:small subunit ribosomal protein S16